MIEDDRGKMQNFIINKALHVPDAKQRLCCSDQWAQQRGDNYPNIQGI